MTTKKTYYCVAYELYNDNTSKLGIIDKEAVRRPRDQRVTNDIMLCIWHWYDTKFEAELALAAIRQRTIEAVQAAA